MRLKYLPEDSYAARRLTLAEAVVAALGKRVTTSHSNELINSEGVEAMKKVIFIISILVNSMFFGSALAKKVKDVVPEVMQAAANPVIVKAVKEQNAQGVALAKIQELDKVWMDIMNAAKEPTAFGFIQSQRESGIFRLVTMVKTRHFGVRSLSPVYRSRSP